MTLLFILVLLLGLHLKMGSNSLDQNNIFFCFLFLFQSFRLRQPYQQVWRHGWILHTFPWPWIIFVIALSRKCFSCCPEYQIKFFSSYNQKGHVLVTWPQYIEENTNNRITQELLLRATDTTNPLKGQCSKEPWYIWRQKSTTIRSK